MSGDRRITIRVPVREAELLEAAAAGAGVAVGGLVREAALRAFVDVAREIAAGRLVLRAANGAGLASDVEPKAEPSDPGRPASPESNAAIRDRVAAFRRATQLRGG